MNARTLAQAVLLGSLAVRGIVTLTLMMPSLASGGERVTIFVDGIDFAVTAGSPRPENLKPAPKDSSRGFSPTHDESLRSQDSALRVKGSIMDRSIQSPTVPSVPFRDKSYLENSPLGKELAGTGDKDRVLWNGNLFDSKEQRKAVEDLKDKILKASGKDIDIVAHSQGTVISYMALKELADEKGAAGPKINNLITLASPLETAVVSQGEQLLLGRTAPLKEKVSGKYYAPEKLNIQGKWVNVCAQNDPVCRRGGINSTSPKMVNAPFNELVDRPGLTSGEAQLDRDGLLRNDSLQPSGTVAPEVVHTGPGPLEAHSIVYEDARSIRKVAELLSPSGIHGKDAGRVIEREIRDLRVSDDLKVPTGTIDTVRKNLVKNESGEQAYAVLRQAELKTHDAALRALHGASMALQRGDSAEAERLLSESRRLKIRMGEIGALAARAYAGEIKEGYERFIGRVESGAGIMETVGGAPGKGVGLTLEIVAAALKTIVDYETVGARGAAAEFARKKAEDYIKSLLEKVISGKISPREVIEIAKLTQDGWNLAKGSDLGERLGETLSKAAKEAAALHRKGEDAILQVKSLRDKARREFQRDMGFAGREERFAQALKAADYQLAKTAVDAHGDRVRIEGYILRPSPNQIQNLVLNTRASRFDYMYMLSTFFRPVSGLAEAGRAVAATFGGRTAPSNYLTNYELVASNTQDRVQSSLVLGAPQALNYGGTIGIRFFPATLTSKLRLSGPGYDKIKEDIAWSHNGAQYTFTIKYPNALGVLSNYANLSYTPSTGACAPCTVDNTVAPTRSDSLGLDGSVSTTWTFKDGTAFGYDTWLVKNDGTVVPPWSLSSPVRDPSASRSDLNLEVRFRATEFRRDIDVVIPGEMLRTSANGGQDVRNY